MSALLIGVLLITANALFVAAEFASIAARQSSLEARMAAGSRMAGVALAATRNIQLQLAGAQLGITMASLGLGSVLVPYLDEHLGRVLDRLSFLPEGLAHPVAFVVSLLAVVLVHTVLGEMVPKNLAIAAPEATLMALALPYRAFLWLFRPVIGLLNAVANVGTRLLGVSSRRTLARPSSPAAIAAIVEASHEDGLIEEFAHGLLASVLDLSNRTAAQVMTPWAEVAKVRRQDTVADLEAITVTTGHSRLPLTLPGRASVRWFVHTKDLLAIDVSERHLPVPERFWRRLLLAAPETNLETLLREMRRSRTHLVLVLDQRADASGGLSGGPPLGVVSLEDVLEELVGEIRDESDNAEAGP